MIIDKPRRDSKTFNIKRNHLYMYLSLLQPSDTVPYTGVFASADYLSIWRYSYQFTLNYAFVPGEVIYSNIQVHGGNLVHKQFSSSNISELNA